VRRFERGQNALELGERLERVQGLRIGDVGVFGPPDLAEPRVLGSDGRVIETR
jgi:hypothetical protein